MGDKFYENLKKARKAAGLSQIAVADQLGVAKSTYSLYESGKREPDVPKIKKLAQILGVSSDVLLGITESTTLAAHFDGEDLTPEEKEEVKKFVEFVKSKRS